MSQPAARPASPRIILLGNPNTGKTTLFNRLTGSNARVGNYPGVTVERTVGRCRLSDDQVAEILDVPGCYSLIARSPEEQIAVQSLLEGPDLVVVVVDANNLTRNLYLVLQVLELGLPVVVALNMIDEARELPSADDLSALLSAPVVPISARTRQNIDGLRTVLRYAVGAPSVPLQLRYPDDIEVDIAAITPLLPGGWSGAQARGMALWSLMSIDDDDQLTGIPEDLREAVRSRGSGRDLDAAIISARYAFLDSAIPDVPPPDRSATERIDRVLLHPVAGFGVFLVLMMLMFQSLFAWADPLIGLVESGIGALSELATSALPAGLFADLIIEGVIGGVGNVVVFLPQILLLFFFIGLLEDSGYMARAAYLMDRVMKSLGLQGRAFVPMLSGFACAIPAVMATRTMAKRRDRMLTMMVIPLMTCSARLPVYTLLIAALFASPPTPAGIPASALQASLMMGMYLFSTVIALLAAWVLGKTVLPGQHEPLLIELPPMRLPTLVSTVRLMWQRARVFLTEAGTVILTCTLLLWGLLSFPQLPEPGPGAPETEVVAWQAEQLEGSYAGQLGKTIEPVIAPLGFDWKIGVGLIGAFAAREVFVSTMGVVYGVGEEVDEESPSLREKLAAERRPDGTPTYTPLVGLSLMVFFALACQCMSTLAVVKRETRGYRWPAFLFGYMTALAWVCSFVIYQGGRLLGFG